MEGKASVFCKRPDSELYHTNMSLSLKNLQTFVGGYIEVVPIGRFKGQYVVMVVNEEGKLRGDCELNFRWGFPKVDVFDYIFGNVIFMAARGDELMGLDGTNKGVKEWLHEQGLEV